MSAADLPALADRCEAATGPDRELDALIWCAFNNKRYVGHSEAYTPFGRDNAETQVEFTEPPRRRTNVTGAYGMRHAQPWTASLDVALGLVPADCVWGVSNRDPDPEVFRASVMPVMNAPGEAQAATPALALTAAALRARAALGLVIGGAL